jgi:surface antigen
MILFRIIRNLIRLALNLLWLPIALITRNLFGIVILVAVIAFFVILSNDDSVKQEQMAVPAGAVKTGTVMSTPPPAPPPTDKNAPPISIDTVRKVENGNSSFAKDLLKMMSANERAYYSNIFYWTMNNASAGKTIHWNNLNTFGAITPQAIFLNNKGHACRKFTETLKVKDIKQNIKGIACQRGGGAWCKLGPNATPSCGLGQMPSLWNDIKRSVGL